MYYSDETSVHLGKKKTDFFIFIFATIKNYITWTIIIDVIVLL